jgi:hypothetical protein
MGVVPGGSTGAVGLVSPVPFDQKSNNQTAG